MFRVQYRWFGGPDILEAIEDAPEPKPGPEDVVGFGQGASIAMSGSTAQQLRQKVTARPGRR